LDYTDSSTIIYGAGSPEVKVKNEKRERIVATFLSRIRD
jgi:hypothetical protein